MKKIHALINFLQGNIILIKYLFSLLFPIISLLFWASPASATDSKNTKPAQSTPIKSEAAVAIIPLAGSIIDLVKAGINNEKENTALRVKIVQAIRNYLSESMIMVIGTSEEGASAGARRGLSSESFRMTAVELESNWRSTENLKHLLDTIYVAGNLARVGPDLPNPTEFFGHLHLLDSKISDLVFNKVGSSSWNADGSMEICKVSLDPKVKEQVQKMRDFKGRALECDPSRQYQQP